MMTPHHKVCTMLLVAALSVGGLGTGRASAQEALAASAPLRIAAISQTRVMMVQGTAADPYVWEWSFFNEETTSEDDVFDTVAISVMYDCDAWTRRALVLEAYSDVRFVFETPLYEEPAPITPGTLVDGVAQVVCQPETNSDGAVFPDLTTAWAAMNARSTALASEQRSREQP